MNTDTSLNALSDQYLKMVGRLVVNAANCDLMLYSAFKIISGCESKIANAIYFSSETLQVKKSFINRILTANNDPSETNIVEQIITATEKAQNQRNELSHALLMANGNQISRVNARHPVQNEKPITAPYLNSLLKNSGSAHLDALLQYQSLCQKRGISQTISHE